MDRIERDAQEREIAIYLPLVQETRAELARLRGDAPRAPGQTVDSGLVGTST
jgi:hypothetical protein